MKKYSLWGMGLLLVLGLTTPVFAGEAWERVQKTGELRWGAEVVGGAPYVFSDPSDPKKIIGFEVEVMDAICRELGVRPRLVAIPWDQLVPALLRDDFDIAFNGLEVTQPRQESISFSVPYYIFSEQISVRKNESRIKNFSDLEGKRVGTLSTTLAQNMLEENGRAIVVPYPSTVEVYKDLEIGRIDAAFQDVPIAAYYISLNPNLKNVGTPVGEALYAAGIRKDSPILREKMNEAIKKLIAKGQLEKIYRKWEMWTHSQIKLSQMADLETQQSRSGKPFFKYLPLIIKGAGMTLILSVLAMILAVIFGFMLCLGKLYGNFLIKSLCHLYIEVIRGTPLLIQLYLLYYGLPNLGIQLNAFCAAILGMGMNYAAYEAEIYRAGLLSIPKGQEEAARSLGMTRSQSLRYVIIPQAVRTILPPSTNDFIALFKDTSLVSIITVTELTRAYNQAATATYRFLELGILTAALYLLMSLPLSLWSRAMEARRHQMAV